MASIKLPIPVHQFPNYNFVGRILGPRGATLKTIQQSTQCQICIRGKGSIRDRAEEERRRGTFGNEHLEEELHVLIEAYGGSTAECEAKVQNAKEKIQELLVPQQDSDDALKHEQLKQLKMIRWEEQQREMQRETMEQQRGGFSGGGGGYDSFSGGGGSAGGAGGGPMRRSSDRSSRSHPYDDRGSSYSHRDREPFRDHRDDRGSSGRDYGEPASASLGTLKAEWEKLAPFRSVLPECTKLLSREIAKLEASGDGRGGRY